MDEIMQEIMRLREEVDELKQQVHESGRHGGPSDIDAEQVGRSFSRLIRYGPSSAARSWLNSYRFKKQIFSKIGIGSTGFLSGLAGGFWSIGIDYLIKGLTKLFSSKRSPLLSAKTPEKVFNVTPEFDVPDFQPMLTSELIRGRSSRSMMRESSGDSLENQIRRGVVGL